MKSCWSFLRNCAGKAEKQKPTPNRAAPPPQIMPVVDDIILAGN